MKYIKQEPRLLIMSFEEKPFSSMKGFKPSEVKSYPSSLKRI
jgi:hypothetical protein